MKIGETITVVDFGGSKIVAVTALCTQIGRYELLAKEEEPTGGAVRRGLITDPKMAGEKLYNIILRLKASLARRKEMKIQTIHVLLGGMSLRTELAECTLNIGSEYKVSADDLQELKTMDPDIHLLKDEKVYASRDLGFFTDGVPNESPKDINCNLLSQRSLCLVGASRLEEALSEAFSYVRGLEKMSIVLHRDAHARLYFKGHETEETALVDMGESCTSVSVFRGSTPIHYEVIPLGGSSITRDIASTGIDLAEAERIKCQFGQAKLDLSKDDEELLPNLSLHKLNIIIEARLTEILQNVRNVILRSGLDLRNMREGVVFTGGGSQVNNFWDLAKDLFPETSIRPMNYDRRPFECSAELNLFDQSHTSILGAILCASNTNVLISTIDMPRYEKEERSLIFEDDYPQNPTTESGDAMDMGQQIENILKSDSPTPEVSKTETPKNKIEIPKEKKQKKDLFKKMTKSIVNLFDDEPHNIEVDEPHKKEGNGNNEL